MISSNRCNKLSTPLTVAHIRERREVGSFQNIFNSGRNVKLPHFVERKGPEIIVGN
eukprot:Awhi_evm2s872